MEAEEAGQNKDEGFIPEEDFGGGGGGCQHPECAIEHIIAHSIESISEAVAAFDYQGWELSPQITLILREFGQSLVEVFKEVDDEEAKSLGIIVGTPYPTFHEDDE
jgi:hypothetical protein